jgi:hypothetical protein
MLFWSRGGEDGWEIIRERLARKADRLDGSRIISCSTSRLRCSGRRYAGFDEPLLRMSGEARPWHFWSTEAVRVGVPPAAEWR